MDMYMYMYMYNVHVDKCRVYYIATPHLEMVDKKWLLASQWVWLNSDH